MATAASNAPDKRRMILDAAVRVFARQGFHHCRVSDVAGEAGREDGSFKSGVPSEFAAMCFYGAIEQLLTGWIFEVLPRTEEEFEGAKDLIVEAICGGLENGEHAVPASDPSPGAVDRPPVSG
jgi:hypothetical protein